MKALFFLFLISSAIFHNNFTNTVVNFNNDDTLILQIEQKNYQVNIHNHFPVVDSIESSKCFRDPLTYKTINLLIANNIINRISNRTDYFLCEDYEHCLKLHEDHDKIHSETLEKFNRLFEITPNLESPKEHYERPKSVENREPQMPDVMLEDGSKQEIKRWDENPLLSEPYIFRGKNVGSIIKGIVTSFNPTNTPRYNFNRNLIKSNINYIPYESKFLNSSNTVSLENWIKDTKDENLKLDLSNVTCSAQNFLWFLVELDYLVEEIGFHMSADAKTREWLDTEDGHSWLNSNLEYNIGFFLEDLKISEKLEYLMPVLESSKCTKVAITLAK